MGNAYKCDACGELFEGKNVIRVKGPLEVDATTGERPSDDAYDVCPECSKRAVNELIALAFDTWDGEDYPDFRGSVLVALGIRKGRA
jgi:DNA-directed RNA polymerase subunit RPC12/RpoP